MKEGVGKKGFKVLIIVLVLIVAVFVIFNLVFPNFFVNLSLGKFSNLKGNLATLSGSGDYICDLDSDNNENYYLKGTLVGRDYDYTDYCWKDKDPTLTPASLNYNKLREYSCTLNKTPLDKNIQGYGVGDFYEINYLCPNGCSDGACLKNNSVKRTISGDQVTLNIHLESLENPEKAFFETAVIAEQLPTGFVISSSSINTSYNNSNLFVWVFSSDNPPSILTYDLLDSNSTMRDKPTSFTYDTGGNPVNTYEPPGLASDENWDTSIYVQDGSAYNQIILYENWNYLPDFANGIKLKSKYRFDCYYADSYSASVGLSCWDYNANKWALIKNYVCSPNDVLYEQKTVTNNILSGCIKLNNPIKIKTYLNGESNSDAVYFYENAIYTTSVPMNPSYTSDNAGGGESGFGNWDGEFGNAGPAYDENWNTAAEVEADGSGVYEKTVGLYENWTWNPEFANGVKLKSLANLQEMDSGRLKFECFNYLSNNWALVKQYNSPVAASGLKTNDIPVSCISPNKPLAIKTELYVSKDTGFGIAYYYENAIGYSSNSSEIKGKWGLKNENIEGVIKNV